MTASNRLPAILTALALTCCAGPTPPPSDLPPDFIRIEPRPFRGALLRVPAAGGAWLLRIPEAVFADPAETLVDWNEPDAAGAWAAGEGGAWRGTFTTRRGVASTVTLCPCGDVLEMSVRLANAGDRPLRNVTAHVCLSHDHGGGPEIYADPRQERTLVVREGAVLRLSAIQKRIRSHYLVEGRRPIPALGEGLLGRFWGPLAAETVDLPLIAGVSESGRHLVAMAWGAGAEVLQNGDRDNRCIHVDPSVGDLAPGESREVRGRLYFMAGGAGALLDRFHADREAGRRETHWGRNHCKTVAPPLQ